jgi:hypothetical protein
MLTPPTTAAGAWTARLADALISTPALSSMGARFVEPDDHEVVAGRLQRLDGPTLVEQL